MGLLPRLLILTAAVVCVSCKSLPLPSYIKACYRDDPNLDECATKNGQLALPMVIKGDRKYKIPVMDPLEIDELVIAKGNGSVSIDLKAKNVKLSGFRNTQIKSARFNLEDKTVTVRMFDPSLQIIADYSINGKILILPITGQGFCNLTLDNADFTYKIKYNLIKKADGLEHIVPGDYNLSLKVTKAHVRLDNLFNGDKALSDNMNQVLNDNWQVIFDELGPPLCEGVGLVLKQVLTNAISNIPYDVIFPVKS